MSVEQTLLKELEDSKKWLDQENGGLDTTMIFKKGLNY
jgi:hypothetical protein